MLIFSFLVFFPRQGTAIHALKRYSAFVQLRNDLLRALPNLKGQLPRLPPKSSLCTFPALFLRQHPPLSVG